MIKLKNTEVMGWEAVIRGMRNPLNSWDKSDTSICVVKDEDKCKECNAFRKNDGVFSFCTQPFIIGPNDFDLMKRLRNAGADHRKFMRMITVYVDVIAPLYWWKEFDTYKVGTVANSCSTMHKIADKEFTVDDFSLEHLMSYSEGLEDDFLVYSEGDRFSPATTMYLTIDMLNLARQRYLEAKTKPMKEESKRAEITKRYWWQMIQLLPSSYNQRRTVMLNYEVLANIYKSRRNHKLDEWHIFCDWIEGLPYGQLITGEFDKNK